MARTPLVREVEKLLAEEIAEAEERYSGLMVQIADFKRHWQEFETIRDQAPAPAPATKHSIYTTA